MIVRYFMIITTIFSTLLGYVNCTDDYWIPIFPSIVIRLGTRTLIQGLRRRRLGQYGTVSCLHEGWYRHQSQTQHYPTNTKHKKQTSSPGTALKIRRPRTLPTNKSPIRIPTNILLRLNIRPSTVSTFLITGYLHAAPNIVGIKGTFPCDVKSAFGFAGGHLETDSATKVGGIAEGADGGVGGCCEGEQCGRQEEEFHVCCGYGRFKWLSGCRRTGWLLWFLGCIRVARSR